MSEILGAINGSDLVVGDLTTLNPNVLFEVGYAIGAEKRIWLLLDKHDDQAFPRWKSFGLLSAVGYAPWANSDEIRARFLQVRPDLQVDPLWPQLTAGAQPLDTSGIFLLPALHDTDPNRQLLRVMEARTRTGFNVVVADPSESRLETLSWYAERVYESTSVVVHLESQRKARHQGHNARAALVAGMAAGAGRDLLMLAEEDYQAPFDYQDLLKRYRNAGDCGVIADESLEQSQVRPRPASDHGRRRLAVELRSLRFGEHVAENEIQQLPNYFVETAAFGDLLAGGTAVYVGRKGTGKTANMYLAAADLRADAQNLVVVLKPAAYDFEALVELLQGLEGSLREHAVDAIWKFLLLTEIARAALDEIEGRPKYLPIAAQETEFLDFISVTPFSVRDDVAGRIELAVASLMKSEVRGTGGVQQRTQLSQALHEEWIGRLRNHLHHLLRGRGRVAVLVDNLDKGWDRRADLPVLSRLLLGLLSAIGHVSRDLRKGDLERAVPLDVSLALFLRGDIYSYLTSHEAREPDKINVRRVEWADPEVLVSVLEQRYLASRPDGTSPSELWTKFFGDTVRGMPTREYMLSRCLPRPRDLIFFANACVHRAIDRSHPKVTEDDVLSAERLYSQFAFEALLVENGITIAEMEAVLFEFVGGAAFLEESEVAEAMARAGIDGMRSEQVLRKLKEMSFFGIVTGTDSVSYPDTGRDAERAEVMARKAAGGTAGAERVVIHPAFRAYLDVKDAD